MTKTLAERLGGPIAHTFPDNHVLRADKGIRDEEEAYSLFMLCLDETYRREGVFTGKLEWAIEKCTEKIAAATYDIREERFVWKDES